MTTARTSTLVATCFALSAASLAAVGAVLAAIPSWHCYRQPVSSLLRG